MSFAALSHDIMAPGKKRPCTYVCPPIIFHPQRVRDFGDWNTGTYVHFQPNIIVIRTYTPKPQIQIEHYQISQKQLYSSMYTSGIQTLHISIHSIVFRPTNYMLH
jgi:hypothetical protein